MMPATTWALKTLLGKDAADVVDVAKVTDDTANNTVQISYELRNGQLDSATFDAGRVIFAVLGHIPGFRLFGIIGDPAIYCTEAAFWYTGHLGGELGHYLRSKLPSSPPSNPQPSNPQPSNPQPSNPQPSNPGPSPTFVCVTGPGGSCSPPP